MLEGWPLVGVTGVAIAATALLGRTRPWPWAALGALLMVLGLYPLGAGALFMCAVMLVYRISQPQPPSG